MKPLNRTQTAMRVSWVSIAVNVSLTVLKLFAGLFAHSSAMVADAVHSASDIVSTVIVMIGAKVSGKASDHEHPYGHERMECVASVVLASILCVTGLGIGYGGVLKIIEDTAGSLATPGLLALLAALISIVVKEALYWYTRSAAKRIDSSSLMADAWHHRSDALSSIGSFVGVLGARMGLPILDPIASLVICLFILKVAVSIFREAVDRLVDRSCDDDTVHKLRQTILAQPGVMRLDLLKTRLFESKIYVDIEIGVDETLSMRDAHRIAESVHDALEKQFPKIKHCMVHVNPAAAPVQP